MAEKRRDNKGRILRTGEVQRKDGLYMYRYTDMNGQRRTVYSWKLVETDKVPNGKRCTDALRDIEKQIQINMADGIKSHEAKSITLDMLFQRFMDTRIDLKESSRCNYTFLYNKHIKNSIGYRKIASIKYTELQQLYISLHQETGLSFSSIEKIHAIIYQSLEIAVLDNLIKSNPSAHVMKSFRKLIPSKTQKKRALTIEEQSRFIEYVYQSNVYNRLGPLFTVLLGTGMRIGEALGLRWCDCDFDKGIINITHILTYRMREHGGYGYSISSPKTIAGLRTIPMLSDVKEALLVERSRPRDPSIPQFYVGEYTGFIFLNNKGRVYQANYVFDALQKIIDLYNREEYFKALDEKRKPCYLPRFGPHVLRHTFCTRLCENESNLKIIQDVMGHNNIRTTMDIYNDATEEKKLESFHALDGKIKVV